MHFDSLQYNNEMHTYVFKDIAVGGHLNSLEKSTVSLTIRIKLRISIYIQEYCNRWRSSFSSFLYCACVISICHMIPAKMTCPAAWSKSDSNKTNDRVLCKNICVWRKILNTSGRWVESKTCTGLCFISSKRSAVLYHVLHMNHHRRYLA